MNKLRFYIIKIFQMFFLIFGLLVPWFTWTFIQQYKQLASNYLSFNVKWSPLRLSTIEIGPWQNQGRYCYKNDSSVIVFLHVTNNSNHWTNIEMCAFKLAAINNKDTGVCVLSAYPMQPHPSLVALDNLEISQLDFSLLFNDTPLFDWYDKYIVKNKKPSQIWMWEVADALRYTYLYKYGGKYMDTDSWTLRNLAPLKNTAGWQEDNGLIANGVLFFEKGHPFIDAVISNFTKYFSAGVWGSSGPWLVTNIHRSGRVDNRTYQLSPVHYFYPTHYSQNHYPFMATHTNAVKGMIKESYAIHLWRYMIRGFYEKPPPNGSFVEEILKTVCQ